MGVSRFSVELFLPHTAEKFRRGNLYCCISFGYWKSLDKKGAIIKIFRRDFLSHSAKNFCRGIIYCCTDFRYRKSLERRGEYQDAPSKIFCLTMPKISVGESSIVSLISGTEKVWKGGGVVEYQDVPSKFFCLTLPKISVGEISIVALISGTGKVWIRRGRLSSFSVEIFLSQSAKKFCRGIFFCCTDFRYRKVWKGGGSIKMLHRKFFVSQCRKFP